MNIVYICSLRSTYLNETGDIVIRSHHDQCCRYIISQLEALF